MKTLKVIIIIVCLFAINCVYGQKKQDGLAKISLDYSKYDLRQGNIPEKWEDGMRTNAKKRYL